MTNPGSGAPVERRRIACFLFLALILALSGSLAVMPALAQPGGVRVQLSSSTITIGESVRLAIVASGIDGELDASALEREFDVVGQSSSRDVQVTNGVRRSTVTWVLELVPREVGVFTVPAVSVGGVQSDLVTLTVTEEPSGRERDIFVEASVDDASPYVQSQVILTLRVFLGVDIVEGSLEEPSGDGFDVRRLGDDVRREETRDGRRYEVTERRVALFAQKSGPLSIEPARLSVTVPIDATGSRGFFSPTRRLTRSTAPIELDVRPRPPGGSGWWLPAKAVVFEEDWSGGANVEARVGEPLTRTVRLRASGALDTQLPDIATPSVDGLAIYADDVVRAGGVGAGGVESTLTLPLAVIPERPGTFELPPVEIDWFDVGAGRVRTASLPARTLTVVPGERGGGVSGTTPGAGSPSVDGSDALAPSPGAGGASVEPLPGPPDAGAAAATRWRTLALGALLCWTLTAGALALVLWRGSRASRKRTDGKTGGTGAGSVRPVDTSAVRGRLERAARERDAVALGRAVLERAALRCPDHPPPGLAALADRLDVASRRSGVAVDDSSDAAVVARALRRLEASLYGRRGDARLDTEALELDTLADRLERALGTLDDGASAERHPRAAAAPGERDLPPL